MGRYWLKTMIKKFKFHSFMYFWVYSEIFLNFFLLFSILFSSPPYYSSHYYTCVAWKKKSPDSSVLSLTTRARSFLKQKCRVRIFLYPQNYFIFFFNGKKIITRCLSSQAVAQPFFFFFTFMRKKMLRVDFSVNNINFVQDSWTNKKRNENHFHVRIVF